MKFYRKILRPDTVTDAQADPRNRRGPLSNITDPPTQMRQTDEFFWAEEQRQPTPPHDPATQRLVPMQDVYEDGFTKVGRQEVVALTEEEIGQRKVQAAESAEANINPNIIRNILREQIMATEPDDETLATMPDLFPAWRPWQDVESGQLYQHEGKTIRAVSTHTTQPDWNPLTLPALYTILGEPDPGTGLPAWVQPTGAHDAYPVGAEVMHNGKAWRNTHPANAFEPGVFGWVEFAP
jgi:hypothetical protein